MNQRMASSLKSPLRLLKVKRQTKRHTFGRLTPEGVYCSNRSLVVIFLFFFLRYNVRGLLTT